MRCLLPVILLLAVTTPSPAGAQQEVVEVTAQNVRLRATASIQGSIVTTLRRGVTLIVLGHEGAWLEVRYGEKTGFVRANLVSSVSGAPLPRPGVETVGQVGPPAIRRGDPPRTPSQRDEARGGAEPPSEPSGPRPRPGTEGFAEGVTFIGPSVMLSVAGSSLAFEGHFEHATTRNIGIGAFATYWSYGLGGVGGSADYQVFGLGGTGSYHFEIKDDARWDPFVGVAAAYYIFNSSTVGSFSDLRNSGLVFGAFGGVRYFFKPTIGAVARAGFGIGYLSLGLDFRL